MNPIRIPILAAAAVALSAPVLLVACQAAEVDSKKQANLAEVVRGPFQIQVTESGEIKAAKSTLVKNEMEGSSTIIQLIEEGSVVREGDVLVELDASGQIEKRASQEIAVEKAKAAVINAQKSLDILRKQVDSSNRAAKNAWEFAKMDKEKFYGAKDLATGKREMGEREQSIKAEEAEIALARSELKLAEERYKWSEKLYAKDFITLNDLDRDRLDFKSKETRLTLAINKLAILQKYTHEKTKRELDQAELDARLEWERTMAKGEAEITQAVADLKAKNKESELASERLANLEKQIKSSTVRAPSPGIVVYASEGDRWRRRTIEIGTQVRERQSLIVLPDTTNMEAHLKIQEVDIDKIRPGLPALIKIDTSERQLTGSVIRRAPLPDSGSRGSNPDLKVYKTTIAIDGNNADNVLRPNMSATIRILIARLENVLSVPQTAVFSDREVQYVWLQTPTGPVATKVEVGEHNESHVVILKGLEEGQKVYLVHPEGMESPEFDQPAKQVDETQGLKIPSKVEKASLSAKGGGARKSRGGMKNASARGGSGGASGFMPALEVFKTKAKAIDPDLASKLTGFGWFRDESIKAKIKANPELAAAYAPLEKMMAEMRSRRGGRGSGGGRRGGGEGRPRRSGSKAPK